MTWPTGRQPIHKFHTPEEFQSSIVGYFSYCDSLNQPNEDGKMIITKPYTISGLCDYIGIHKDTYYEYAKKPEYEHITRMAKQKVETFILEMATINKTNVIMSIVNLKNNFGYADKIDVNTNQNVETLDATDIKRMLNESGRNAMKQLSEG
jgi:hypothetical protein